MIDCLKEEKFLEPETVLEHLKNATKEDQHYLATLIEEAVMGDHVSSEDTVVLGRLATMALYAGAHLRRLRQSHEQVGDN